jgi:hypothetical protein
MSEEKFEKIQDSDERMYGPKGILVGDPDTGIGELAVG